MNLILIQYLSDFCSSFSYVVASEYYKNIFYSTTEIFAYCNIYLLLIMIAISPVLKKRYNFNLFNIKHYIKNKNIIYITLLSVLASYSKTILLSNLFDISQLTLRSYSMASPFITLILCHFFLKEQKINKLFFFTFLIVFAGFIIFNANVKLQFSFSVILILYVFFNGYSDYKLKSISSKRSLEMMLFDNLMFLFVSAVVFIIALFNENFTMSTFGIKQFTLTKLFNIQNVVPLFIIALLSFLAHNFKMLSYKAKHIVSIMIVGIFCKSFNSVLMTYLQKNTLPSFTQTFGLFVMCLGFSLFVYKNKT